MTTDEEATQIHDVAVDTLADWLDCYTTPDEGPQLSIRPVAIKDGGDLRIKVETCDSYPSDLREYRITLTVEAL